MKKKRMIAIFLAVVMVMMIPLSASAFDPSKAVDYADEWALSRNSSEYQTGGNWLLATFKDWFPGLTFISDADCTNFVSQCLDAGGLPQNSNWKYDGRSNSTASWYVADALKDYLKYTYGATQLVSKWTKYGQANGYAYKDNSSNLFGNGREVVFYDWEDDGNIDHASYCVGTGWSNDDTSKYGDLINQHSNDRKRILFHLDEKNPYRATTAIYAFEVR